MDPVKVRTGVIAGAAALGVAGVLLLASGLSQLDTPVGGAGQPVRPPSPRRDVHRGSDAPDESAQPDWTHRELLAHLRSRGLQFFSTEPPGGMTSRPALLLMPEKDGLRLLSLPAYPFTDEHWRGCALVEKWPTPGEARDQAGLKGEYGLSWGYFVFIGDKAFLAQIRKALP
jgi:hypothetical protein